MKTLHLFKVILVAVLLPGFPAAQAQMADSVLSLPQALRLSTANHQLLRSKENFVKAAESGVETARREGLPDVVLSAEQAYGTLNGMNGLPSGINGLTTQTAGPVSASQNWNTAFGSLYVTNIDWTLFAFGTQRTRVAEARGQYEQNKLDLQQETFLQQARVATAYLNLLAAGQLRKAMERNLERTLQLRESIRVRTENGLNAGVDSSLANAEVAKARITLLDAINSEAVQSRQLSIQMGIDTRGYQLDTAFTTHLPKNLLQNSDTLLSQHPVLQYLNSRVRVSDLEKKLILRSSLPRVTLFSVLQDRGSGFGTYYNAGDPKDYTGSWLTGVSPARANYMVGIGITWNITNTARSHSQARTQQYLSAGLHNEYLFEKDQLFNQSALADEQVRNALEKYREVPVQLQAASEAYGQKSALYDNGLTTIVDLTQTLYLFNRAEIDKEVAANAVWQALLLKAAASGDMNGFLQQF